MYNEKDVYFKGNIENLKNICISEVVVWTKEKGIGSFYLF
jgi:hypothetical protein